MLLPSYNKYDTFYGTLFTAYYYTTHTMLESRLSADSLIQHDDHRPT